MNDLKGTKGGLRDTAGTKESEIPLLLSQLRARVSQVEGIRKVLKASCNPVSRSNYQHMPGRLYSVCSTVLLVANDCTRGDVCMKLYNFQYMRE